MAKDEDCICEDVEVAKPKENAVAADASSGAAKHREALHASHGHRDSQQASQKEMVANRLPLGSRDACAHLLIPLNKCRVEKFYVPWKCVDERHGYEKCEYDLFLRRVRKMEELQGY